MTAVEPLRHGRPRPASVPLRRVLYSDVRVWARSPLLLAPLAAGAVAVLTTVLLLSTGAPTWGRFLAHLNMWVVVVGPGFLAVVAGQVATREAADGRAVATRAIHPGTRTVAGSVLLLAVGAAMHLAQTLVTFVGYAVFGAGHDVSLGRALVDAVAVAAALTAGGALSAVLLRIAGEKAGMAGCLVTGLVLVLTGLLWAEHPSWWAVPSTWHLRAVLPLIDTRANGVALEGATLPGATGAVVASVVAAVLVCTVRAVLARTPRRADRGPRAAAVTERAHRPATLSARPGPTVAVAVLRRSGVVSLAVGAVALVAFLCRYREPGEVALVAALLLLPLGCGLLPVVVVGRWRSGMRAVAVRAVSPAVLASHVLAALVAIVVTVVLAVTAVLLGDGLAPADALTLLPVWIAVGTMLTMLSAVLVATSGALASLLVTVAGTTAGLLVGGNEPFRDAFGVLVPWAWPAALADAQMRVTLPASVVLTVILGAVAVRLLATRTSRMG
ncbi:hypothetical protein [Cellulomonas xiejunii]|uniref:hypothetical protein n=1 Tax=Cellulomonas xiejunii TaxID=2968083 RepID=UPI001D0EF3BD|nr:hypothetical protein [Cellulomonas xiejunii]MCC2316059.1 hypothetical protein [Cellulomonas xiejunii]